MFNKYDGVIVIVDNYYASATGGQDILSSRAENPDRSTNNPIDRAVRGAGVRVRTLDRTYDVAKVRATIEEALTTDVKGPTVIIAQSECMLNKQRRIKPLFNKAVKEGKRAVGNASASTRRLHRRPRLYPAVRLPLADRQRQRRSAKGRPGRARGKQLRGLRQLR